MMDFLDFCIIVLFLGMLVFAAITNPAFIPCAAVVGGSILVLLVAGLIYNCLGKALMKKEEEKEALKQELKKYIDDKINEKEANN